MYPYVCRQTSFDAVLHCGDLAYDLNSDGGRRGDRWLNRVQGMAAATPYLVSPGACVVTLALPLTWQRCVRRLTRAPASGNHEVAANFSAFRERFRGMPGAPASALAAAPPGGAASPLYWSLDVGPVHLVSYNTEVYFWPALYGVASAAAQHAWLERDLAAADANRAAVPWVVVMGHRPMYCVATGADGKCDVEHEASRTVRPQRGSFTQVACRFPARAERCVVSLRRGRWWCATR